MTFNQLLKEAGFDLQSVLIMRHHPEPELRKVISWLAAEKPPLFNAYQQNQEVKVEKALQSAKLLASFIGSRATKATFVGLYEVAG